MFDTSIFNDILDDKLDLGLFTGAVKCFVTHVQSDEIRATPNPARRSQLDALFTVIPKNEVPTASLDLDVSSLNKACLSDGVLHGKLMARLNQLNKRKRNNPQDVLIAETAIANKYTLVTHDRDLFRVVTEFRGAAANLYHFLAIASGSDS